MAIFCRGKLLLQPGEVRQVRRDLGAARTGREKSLFKSGLIILKRENQNNDSQETREALNKLTKIITASLLSLSIGLGAGLFFTSSAQDEKVFELRTYTATPGNLDNLHARFRDHTTRIFNKHGMKVVGYWSPTSEEERDDTLVYILEHASQEAANASWRAFGQDPEWQEVAEASNANGQILGGIERKYMVATDYSPMR